MMIARSLAAVCLAALVLAGAGCLRTATPGPALQSPVTTSTPPPAGASPSTAPTPPQPTATARSVPATATATSTPSPAKTPPPAQSPTPRAVPVPVNPFSARAWDWARVVATDPDLDHPDVPDFGGVAMGPYVEARGAGGLVAAQGYAMTSPIDIAFVDLDADGRDEATVQLFSGGTAGNTGLLIYKTGDGLPRLAAYMGGYKLWARADGRELLVTEPIYAGWEPNCCPSGFSETYYLLDVDRLVASRRTQGGHEEAKALTVEEFYARLGRRAYGDAYSFLSATFRAANPYTAWKAGYDATASIDAHVSELADGRVGVDLLAVDQTQTGSVSRRYRGTWILIWSSSASQWLLDVAEIAAVQ